MAGTVRLEPIRPGRPRATQSDPGGPSLEATVGNARRLRTAVESDVKFLENRLAKLRLEEARAKKEIERTRFKTAEVLAERKAHEEKLRARQEDAHRDQAERKREAAALALKKEEHLKQVWDARAALLKQRRAEVDAARRAREMNLYRLHIQREDVREKARSTREIVKSQAEAVRAAREREEEKRREAARKAAAARLEEDQKERERLEARAAQLSQEEAELIYRLKRMHLEKHEAVSDLAQALQIASAEQQEADLEAFEAAERGRVLRESGKIRAGDSSGAEGGVPSRRAPAEGAAGAGAAAVRPRSSAATRQRAAASE